MPFFLSCPLAYTVNLFVVLFDTVKFVDASLFVPVPVSITEYAVDEKAIGNE